MALDINYFRVVNRPAEIVNSTTGHTPITSPSVADKNVSDLSLDGTNVYKFNHLKESQKATLTGVNEGENDLFTKNERKEDNILTSYHENRIITSPNTESSPLRPLLYHKIEEKPVNEVSFGVNQTNPNIINDDNLNYQPISFKPPALINNSNLFSKQQPSVLDTV